ncbi:MAG: nucleotidyltransferase family protein [Pseudomonadota bacterium]
MFPNRRAAIAGKSPAIVAWTNRVGSFELAEFGINLAKTMSDAAFIDDFLARSLRSAQSQQDAVWTLTAETNWEQVWARVEYHGIAFLLNRHSRRICDWPYKLQERIAEEARLIALWETTHLNALVRVIDALADAGIETVLMKGTALAYSFHDEPATRRRGDTDLLIRPKDRVRTRMILLELGWHRKEDPHGLYYQEGWLYHSAGFFVHSIDLHWEPSDRPTLQGSLPINAFFNNRIKVPRLHPRAYRPCSALMIVHATINQKWHALFGYHSESGRLASPKRLIWSIDLSLICQSMTVDDWHELETHCNAHGIGALVAKALRGMQSDIHNAIPEESLANLEAQPLDADVASYFASSDSLTQFRIDLKRTSSLRKKARLIRMRAFPPRQHLLEKYPTAKNWPTAVLQGRLLIETAGRAVRKVGSR